MTLARLRVQWERARSLVQQNEVPAIEALAITVETQPGRDAQRGGIGRIDDTDLTPRAEDLLVPRNRRCHSLGGVTAAGRPLRDHPGGFRMRLEIITKPALEMGEADIAYVATGLPFLDREETIAEGGPVADVSQDTGPILLSVIRTAYEAHEMPVVRHRDSCLQVVRTVPAQAQTRGLDHRPDVATAHRS